MATLVMRIAVTDYAESGFFVAEQRQRNHLHAERNAIVLSAKFETAAWR